MKRLILTTIAFAVAAVTASGLGIARSTRAKTDSDYDFTKVIEAHGGREAIATIRGFEAEATRLTPTVAPAFFERRLFVSVQGDSFRRETTDLRRGTKTIELLSSRGEFTAVRRPEAAEQPLVADAARLHTTQSAIENFGLVHILRLCLDSDSRVESHTASYQGLKQFEMKTRSGMLLLYVDEQGLIARVERGSVILQFADYRWTQGLRLPFIQKTSTPRRTVFEYFFSRIEINPRYAPDFEAIPG